MKKKSIEFNLLLFFFGSNFRAALTTTIFCVVFLAVFCTFISNYEFEWKRNQRKINQQLQQSTGQEATIILDHYRAEDVYIPSSVTATSGGETVVLKGPKDEIVKIHRLAWDLD